ncbi:unnamed protein product [Paramecium octaurelia]|uniref:Uncharacterized protein n=1 Tax=Paramecium octaurelia TaxID=43137 RepID=A0A8S1XHL9_PAROT|nr:unnamed protein product [Paramecium octaurelia]
MGQSLASKRDIFSNDQQLQLQPQQELEKCIRHCGVSKFEDQTYKIILHLENEKYYQFLYKQLDDGSFDKKQHGYCGDQLIIIMNEDYHKMANDKLKLKDALIFYEESNDPNNFFKKIVDNVQKDFDALEYVQNNFNNEEKLNNSQFTSVFKLCNQQHQLVFANSHMNYLLVNLDKQKIQKTYQYLVCSQKFILEKPHSEKDVLNLIKKHNDVDSLINEITKKQ